MPFDRRILHYGPGPTDFIGRVDDRAVVGCWFELHRLGGCGAGELKLRDEFPQRNAIAVGDWIACEASASDRWYIGRVQQRSAKSPAVVTLRLEGAGVELGEVFPGGFGRAVADGVPPHRYAQTDLFLFDPDYFDETLDVVSRADELVSLVLAQYVAPRTHVLHEPSLIEEAPEATVMSVKFRGEESAKAIIKEQAVRAQNAAWGVREDRNFFFLQARTSVLATYREGRDLLSLEETADLEMLFNRLTLTGDYIYNEPFDSAGNFRGFYRWRGNYIQPASRSEHGERRIRMWVPWIRTREDAHQFVSEFFRVYSQPVTRYLIDVGNKTTLPRPWEGVIRVEARDGSELITVAAETIRVQFDHAPRFRMELGPADPRTLWPEPPHDERWEIPGHGAQSGHGGDDVTLPRTSEMASSSDEMSSESTGASSSDLESSSEVMSSSDGYSSGASSDAGTSEQSSGEISSEDSSAFDSSNDDGSTDGSSTAGTSEPGGSEETSSGLTSSGDVSSSQFASSGNGSNGSGFSWP